MRLRLTKEGTQNQASTAQWPNWRVIAAVVISTFSVVVERYQSPFRNEILDHLLFFGLMPLVAVLVFRQNPRDYGIQIGKFKFGAVVTLISCLFMTLVMLVIARADDFRAYYGFNSDSFWSIIGNHGLDLIGWEFLFRGFLLFALLPTCGPLAIFLQAVPFTIAHIGKPEIETYSCIFGGAFLGWLAWRTRSFLYPFIIHWYLAVITTLFSRGF